MLPFFFFSFCNGTGLGVATAYSSATSILITCWKFSAYQSHPNLLKIQDMFRRLIPFCRFGFWCLQFQSCLVISYLCLSKFSYFRFLVMWTSLIGPLKKYFLYVLYVITDSTAPESILNSISLCLIVNFYPPGTSYSYWVDAHDFVSIDFIQFRFATGRLISRQFFSLPGSKLLNFFFEYVHSG